MPMDNWDRVPELEEDVEVTTGDDPQSQEIVRQEDLPEYRKALENRRRRLWLEERRTGIGGSDAAPSLGLSRWMSPYELYLEKLGELPPKPETWEMKRGRSLEPGILEWYSEETGARMHKPDLIRHPDFPYILANLDSLAELPDGRFKVVEAKATGSSRGWGEPGTDQVPEEYLIQVQHYQGVIRATLHIEVVADIAVSICGRKPQVYTVEPDSELQGMLFRSHGEFWSMVQRREPPAITRVSGLLRSATSTQGVVTATEAVLSAVLQLREVKAKKSEIEALEDELTEEVKLAIGDDHDTLVAPDGQMLATWRSHAKASGKLDEKALLAEHPDIYRKFWRPSKPRRPLLLK